MAQNELAILVRVKDEATGPLSTLTSKVSGLSGALHTVTSVAGGFVLGEGLMEAPRMLMDFADAAAEDAASVARLQRAVENTGASWDEYADQFDAVIKKAQEYGFTDDQARAALALLTAQTDSAEEAQKRFAMAQDLSRGANIDLYTASRLLGKATEENVNVLARYGIEAKEGMTQTELFAEIQRKFGGQAEIFAKSTAGQMERAKIAMDELKESLGYAILPALAALTTFLNNTIIPAFEKLINLIGPPISAAINKLVELLRQLAQGGLGDLQPHLEIFVRNIIDVGDAIATWLQNSGLLQAALDGLKTVFEAVAAAVQLVWPPLSSLFTTILTHKETVIALAVALGILVVAMAPIPVAITGLLIAIGLLREHWDDIRAKTLEVWQSIAAFIDERLGYIKALVLDVFAVIKTEIEIRMNLIRDIIRIVMALINGEWGEAWQAIRQLAIDLLEAIATEVTNSLNLVNDLFAGFPGRVLGYLGEWARAGMELGSAILNAIIDALGDLVGLGGSIATDIGTGITSSLGGAYLVAYNLSQTIIRGIWDGLGYIAGIGEAIATGIWNGLQSMAGWLYDRVWNWAKGIYDSIKSALGDLWPFSPSRAGIDIGRGLGLGIEEGIKDILPRVLRAGSTMRQALARELVTGPSYPASAAVAVAGSDVRAPLQSGPTVVNYNLYGNVMIPARDVAEMQSVMDFFARLRQVARART